ncbi:MAG: hypothetical protein KC462_02190, partial [Cyanobacteria bacterium HKST-UBA05]|nr:hypothetical protein [Cyanobacteria bacterium HKST-UBA05]
LMHNHRGLFGNPEAKGFHQLILEANSLANPAQQRLVKRLGKAILFSGIAGTALCLGISMTLLTQWFTKQKVRREEAERASRRRVAPVSVSVPVSVPVPRQIPGSTPMPIATPIRSVPAILPLNQSSGQSLGQGVVQQPFLYQNPGTLMLPAFDHVYPYRQAPASMVESRHIIQSPYSGQRS